MYQDPRIKGELHRLVSVGASHLRAERVDGFLVVTGLVPPSPVVLGRCANCVVLLSLTH